MGRALRRRHNYGIEAQQQVNKIDVQELKKLMALKLTVQGHVIRLGHIQSKGL